MAECTRCEFRDRGGEPAVINLERLTRLNRNFRTAIWTGEYMQMTLMSVPTGGEIGFEMHRDLDQLLLIESGFGTVFMGKRRNDPEIAERVSPGYAVFVPAGTWHNIVNTGRTPLKLSSVYAPPQHPRGTVHRTKADSDRDE